MVHNLLTFTHSNQVYHPCIYIFFLELCDLKNANKQGGIDVRIFFARMYFGDRAEDFVAGLYVIL